MNRHLEDLAEEQGKISFIEYPPTGIFVLKINEREYQGTQIQTQVFQLDDEVHVLFNRRSKILYAVLNQSKQILYLDEQISIADTNRILSYIKTAFIFSAMITLFFLLAYPLFQYFMDGTVYYLDTSIHLMICACILFFGRLVYEFIKDKQKNKIELLPQILEKLNLPMMTERMLQSFSLMKGYMYEFEKLYNLKPVFHLKLQMNNKMDMIENYLSHEMKRTNRFGLNVFEIEKSELQVITGELNAVQIERIEARTTHPEPFDEVKFKINGQQYYGFFDEFEFSTGRVIKVVSTRLPDASGYYVWIIYDLLSHLTVDDDLQQFKRKSLFSLDVIADLGKSSMIAFWAFLIGVIFFDLFYMLYCVAIFGFVIFYGKFCYSAYLKFQKSRDIQGFILQQISELFPNINLKNFDKKDFVRCFNQRRGKPSRTGFKKEYRVLD